MSLLKTIQNDLMNVRRNHDALVVTALTPLLAEASRVGKDNGNRESTDAEVIQVVKKFIKGIDESISFCEKVNRNSDALKIEREIYENYLPIQISESQIKIIVEGIVSKLEDKSIKSLGVIMKEFKDKYDGCYDGKIVSEIAKDFLK